jgi:hypothetical protein
VCLPQNAAVGMQRIAIIGNAGGGKSVLARQLGAALALPVHVVDDVQWLPDWQRAPAAAIAAVHRRWMAEPIWIIDGWGEWDLIEARFESADTIVIVDFPLRVHYRWAIQRHLAAVLGLNRGWPPAGCRALPVTMRLLRVMRYVDREFRPRLLNLASEARFGGRVVYLRSPRELRRFRRQAVDGRVGV